MVETRHQDHVQILIHQERFRQVHHQVYWQSGVSKRACGFRGVQTENVCGCSDGKCVGRATALMVQYHNRLYRTLVGTAGG